MSGEDSGTKIIRAYRDHRPYLTDLAFRMLGDIGAAEDAVQDAFTRLLAAKPGRDRGRAGLADRGDQPPVPGPDQVRPRPQGKRARRRGDRVRRAARPGAGRPSRPGHLRRRRQPRPAGRAAAAQPGRAGGLRAARHLPDAVRHRRRDRGPTAQPAASSPAGPGRRSPASHGRAPASTSRPPSTGWSPRSSSPRARTATSAACSTVLAPDAWGDVDLGPDVTECAGRRARRRACREEPAALLGPGRDAGLPSGRRPARAARLHAAPNSPACWCSPCAARSSRRSTSSPTRASSPPSACSCPRRPDHMRERSRS